MKLNKEMVSTLATIIYAHSKNRSVNKKANQMLDPKMVNSVFATSDLAKCKKYLKPVALAVESAKMYTASAECDFTPKYAEPIGFSDCIKNLEKRYADIKLLSKEHADNSVFKQVGKAIACTDKTVHRFKSYSHLVEGRYESTVEHVEKVNYANGLGQKETRLRMHLIHKKVKPWCVEFPLIKANNEIVMGDNTWFFMPSVKNMDRYLSGEDKFMELEHPIEYFWREMLTAFIKEDGTPEMLSQEFFDLRVQYTRKDGTSKKFQSKLANILMHKKENAWDEDTFANIVYFDKHKNAISKWSHEDMLGLDMDYDTLVEHEIIQGVDLLTGSTSTPAVRCKIAMNYEKVLEDDVKDQNGNIISYGTKIIVRKKENVSSDVQIGDIWSEYKASNVGTFRTSSKRDNSCTVSQTYKLVEKQEFRRRVKITSL